MSGKSIIQKKNTISNLYLYHENHNYSHYVSLHFLFLFYCIVFELGICWKSEQELASPNDIR